MANLRSIEKTTRIVTPLTYLREFGADAWKELVEHRPHDYARIVLWLIQGRWQVMGWLMPQPAPAGDGYTYVESYQESDEVWYTSEYVD